jgi:hypothetical protein
LAASSRPIPAAIAHRHGFLDCAQRLRIGMHQTLHTVARFVLGATRADIVKVTVDMSRRCPSARKLARHDCRWRWQRGPADKALLGAAHAKLRQLEDHVRAKPLPHARPCNQQHPNSPWRRQDLYDLTFDLHDEIARRLQDHWWRRHEEQDPALMPRDAIPVPFLPVAGDLGHTRIQVCADCLASAMLAPFPPPGRPGFRAGRSWRPCRPTASLRWRLRCSWRCGAGTRPVCPRRLNSFAPTRTLCVPSPPSIGRSQTEAPAPHPAHHQQVQPHRRPPQVQMLPRHNCRQS